MLKECTRWTYSHSVEANGSICPDKGSPARPYKGAWPGLTRDRSVHGCVADCGAMASRDARTFGFATSSSSEGPSWQAACLPYATSEKTEMLALQSRPLT